MGVFHKKLKEAKAWIERAETAEDIRKALSRIPMQKDAENVEVDIRQLRNQAFLLNNISASCKELIRCLQRLETIKNQIQGKPKLDFGTAKKRSLAEIDLAVKEIAQLKKHLRQLIKKEMILLGDSKKV